MGTSIMLTLAREIIPFPKGEGDGDRYNISLFAWREGPHLRVCFSSKRRWKVNSSPCCFTDELCSLIQFGGKVKNMNRVIYNHWKKNTKDCVLEQHV